MNIDDESVDLSIDYLAKLKSQLPDIDPNTSFRGTYYSDGNGYERLNPMEFDSIERIDGVFYLNSKGNKTRISQSLLINMIVESRIVTETLKKFCDEFSEKKSKLRRYLLFFGMSYYPSPGWLDFVDDSNDVDILVDLGDQLMKNSTRRSWWQIVDTETKKVVQSKGFK